MANEKKQFVLYEYLLFFWRKKWAFIAFPVLFAIVGVLVSQFIINEKPFEGDATVFTGSIKTNTFVDPENIKSQYDEQVTNSFDVYVARDKYIRVKVDGSNQDSVQKDLDAITENLTQTLLSHYDVRYKLTSDSIANLEERIKVLEDARAHYETKIIEENIDVEELDSITEMQIWTEQELTNSIASLSRIQSDLVFFEKPQLLSSSVHKADTYLTESVLLGIVLGLVAAVAFLILWKYLFEARRYYHND